MKKIKTWLYAARVRTLPLSISGILVGTALAIAEGHFDLSIFVLALFTTISLQITSNFANDYGDGVKGTDDTRIGPKRALQSGMLSKSELKTGIGVMVVVSLVLSILLIFKAFALQAWVYTVVFLLLGVLSIWAALKYTMGASPYGYHGLGDVFVFAFFGLLAVVGSKFLFTKYITGDVFLPAITIGLLSVGVLNLNNMRDIESDRLHGKHTIAARLGYEKAKVYHYLILGLAFVSMLAYSIINYNGLLSAIYLLAFVPILLHIIKVTKTQNPLRLDSELKKLALSTFLLALLFLMAINYFL
ncbi:1,4-dihydroxy-2-naphthoate octaprenyltransferase [Allomuricauda sp. SCSIO 65647]|uniref:1,4-dihydroxy-2-naphthoate octaprenyltransferase n=1 Tax=Allomuricauda sp. SCSIO 65647 TaxID=2908843 RepID=UPI001F1FAB60|nr:1,4-dihydroxy-2-naphthoate octaprenyltransferase [Muricauda sp. SCSIO 65647]UJH67127.1 1,4-dihydroxy-2-naphthoate octaprenyltransferase [Muricauda sp. SCSIO 65647]